MVRIFKHYIPRSLFVLAFVEFALLMLSFHAGVLIRFDGNPEVSTHLTNIPLEYKSGSFALICALLLVAMGLYQRQQRADYRTVAIRLIWSFLIALPVLLTAFYLVPDLYVGRGAFAWSLGVAFLALLISRFVYLQFTNTALLSRRVLIVGTGKAAQTLEQLKRRSDWQGVSLIGFLHLRGDHDEIDSSKVIRSEKALLDICAEFGADEVVVAVEENRKNYPIEEIIECKLHGVQVTELSTFYEQRTGRIHLDAWSPHRMIFIEGFDASFSRVAVKRLFDLCVSLFGLILAAPLMLVTMLAIKLESAKDPIIYKQVRVGQHGHVFSILKFRSMVTNAEQNGAVWASKNDPRVTKVGAFIRKTRLDELPQLWNVFVGDMSFVGPRPERPVFVDQLTQKIPFYAMRHRVKPGITGWAQVNYPYGDSEADTREKLQYDLYYIKNYSLFLDLTILFQTAEVVLWRKGSR
ncbi:TIGR03013 family XrtA/PEP-CTERM system glycosyltransferase [Permianibacter aggregans]|uniref:Sugar transferase (PEP-CTERM system associated)/exopolysaccharide biosynthesis polyprenyl glycosylphosphotransferase n=1 Tax=Permianibacter aggregans TaxID=1510150 RepID=A0A4R6V4Y2_9GAMM|nr:TIGR03013 family XrtA/PEP-CTERM system glycosyltransferase [Permianibacter aggregans]QGX41433.1 TIGR03013 family PEP-CTERM/XrtA system glycosyltransferase [Permianibacter aggregans]TDQ51224.1 sugar transferase (PEP-CTERM system associated)/exopolysaccharide biosynthesis polyprenyl glycosylphosphotransferase [Permianibacter aggregans]